MDHIDKLDTGFGVFVEDKTLKLLSPERILPKALSFWGKAGIIKTKYKATGRENRNTTIDFRVIYQF